MKRSLFFIILSCIYLTVSAQTSCGWFGAATSSHVQVEGMSVVVDDKMYVFYGFVNGTQITNTVERFDPNTNWNGQWVNRASMLTGVTHTDAVVIGKDIWLIGGFEGNHGGPATSKVQIYNTLTNSWRYGPSLPEVHASGAAVLLAGRIHVIGGLAANRSNMTDHHMVYDLNSPWNGWDTTSYAKPPAPRDHVGYVSLRGKIYIAGGQTGHDGPDPTIDRNELYSYDLVENKWTLEDTLPQVRSHIETGTFTVDGKLIITGGNTSPCCPALLKSILSYDPETKAWTTLCDMPNFLTNPAAKIIGNKFILTHGGLYGYTNPQNATYMFNVVRNTQLELGYSPKQLVLTVPQGLQVERKVMIYTVSGETAFDLELGNKPSWLTGTQTTSATVTPNAQEITLEIDTRNLSAGTNYFYNLTAKESPSGSPQGFQSATLAITLQVGTPLEVELANFSAFLLSPEEALLSWETTREVNHDFFVVERRHESEDRFRPVAQMSAKSPEGEFYQVNDDIKQMQAGYILYRLRMVDKDGRASFSDIESVFLNPNTGKVSIFPNPATDDLHITLNVQQAGDARLTLYNLKGELVLSEQVSWEGGKYNFHLDVSELAAGYYLSKIQTDLDQFTQKVIIR